ncbi:MAG: hypothetical protein R3C32_09835 [Chloroflexota bacterium]
MEAFVSDELIAAAGPEATEARAALGGSEARIVAVTPELMGWTPMATARTACCHRSTPDASLAPLGPRSRPSRCCWCSRRSRSPATLVRCSGPPTAQASTAS